MRFQLDYGFNMFNQMGGSFNYMNSSLNYMGGGLNMLNYMGIFLMLFYMGNNFNLSLYLIFGGMGSFYVLFLFQNQLMYFQGGGYFFMFGMGFMFYFSFIISI